MTEQKQARKAKEHTYDQDKAKAQSKITKENTNLLGSRNVYQILHGQWRLPKNPRTK